MQKVNEQPTLSFESTQKWRAWLKVEHAESNGIWLRIFKKDSGQMTVTYAEALNEALCFGWIDGQKKKYDEKSWIQKFTPRRARSIWSKRNKELIAQLIKEQQMEAAGLKEVESAKADGRWDQAYDSPKNMKVPEDFLLELNKNKKAKAFFETLNKANLYAIAWRLQTAKKPETREKRKTLILEMMQQAKKFH